MHGSLLKRFVGLVVVGAAITLAGHARAQDGLMSEPEQAAVDDAPAQANIPGTLVADPRPKVDLEKRIADLEAAASKAANKEAADKQKAAGKPSVNLGGRMFIDSDAFSQTPESKADFGNARNTTYFRMARLRASGDMFDVFSYGMELEFANRIAADDPANAQFTTFKDVYGQMRDLPLLGTVMVGHFKEPFSLEQLTSDSYTTFMERPTSDVFSPARNIGVAFLRANEEQTMTFGAGVFADVKDAPPYIADEHQGNAFTSRFTWLPWYDEASDGAGLLHLGMNYSYRDTDSTLTAGGKTFSNDSPTQTVKVRPETAIAPYMTAATLTSVDHVNRLGPELAFVYGSFALQSEWVGNWYSRFGDGNPDGFFNGGYIQASYFLTGEHRPYNRAEGRWDRVRPLGNFFRVRTADGDVETGKGAWELAYRFSYVDLQDPSAVAVAGTPLSTLSDHTFGLNWYLTPYSRLMLNYIHGDSVVARTGAAAVPMDILALRCQVDF